MQERTLELLRTCYYFLITKKVIIFGEPKDGFVEIKHNLTEIIKRFYGKFVLIGKHR